jgi:creatinine amidohydrolase
MGSINAENPHPLGASVCRMPPRVVMTRYWDTYASQDLARLPRQHLVAVLPVAAVEQHGPHLPLSTDRIILDGLIAATADLLPESLPALFLPVQAVGKSDAHIRFPGTLALSAGTLLQLLVEIGTSVAAAGVRKLILLNSHGGNTPVLDLAARELRIANDIVAVSANWYAFGLPDGLFTDRERRHGLHAGALETSLMLALAPELVRMQRARDFESLTERLDRNFNHLGTGPGAALGWQAQDLNPAGAVGDATAASAEIGRAVLEHGAQVLARVIDDVHRFPVGLLHNPTEM